MRQVSVYEQLKLTLVPGHVYRRAELADLSSNVDRHLARLLSQGFLKRLSQGMYAAPRKTTFGEALPDERSLIQTFLKDDHFVVYSLNQFNALELGTTQLYNQRIVFNRKRTGEFTLGGRTLTFHRWREAPKSLTVEFLVIELLNRLNDLAENREQILVHLREKVPKLNAKKLQFAASHYGTLSTQKLLSELSEVKTSKRKDT